MKPNLIIDQSHINQDSECYVIAEIGCNHQGEIEKAKSSLPNKNIDLSSLISIDTNILKNLDEVTKIGIKK